MFAFMLIPVWIPLIAVACGYVHDVLTHKPRRIPVDQQVRDRLADSTQHHVVERPLNTHLIPATLTQKAS